MKRLLPFGSLVLLALGCSPSAPTELVPTFTSLTGLPGLPPTDGCTGADCCIDAGWCLDVETLMVRNVGSGTVTISEVSFQSDSDPAFKDLEISTTTLAPDEQASLRFRYSTPTGAAITGTIVIASDAAVNPTLEIGVETLAYTPPDAGPGEQPDAGDDKTDAGDDETDAGGDEPEAGPEEEPDAGSGDAGDEDADSGDAGNDAGGDDEETTDAGGSDAGSSDAGDAG